MLLEFSTYTPKFHFVCMRQISCCNNNDAKVRLQLEHYHCNFKFNRDMQGTGIGKLSSLPLQVVIYFMHAQWWYKKHAPCLYFEKWF